MADFITKESEEKAVFESGMTRDTSRGKARFDLIHPEGIPYKEQIITRFALLMERGLTIYSERNWEKANSLRELKRFKESALRHCEQWFCDETDEDHAVAVFFNIMAYEATKYKVEHGDAE